MAPLTSNTLNYAHGFVKLVKGNIAMNTQVISDLTAIGCKWLRLQVNWSDVEQVQGVYNFTTWDKAIPQLNAAGINVCLPIQNPPSFHQTLACGLNGTLPNIGDTITFTEMVINRYNGVTVNPSTGKPYGTIQAIEFNEDWDNYAYGTQGGSNYACRDATQCGPILQAIYPYAKAQNPNLLVGAPALLGKRQSDAHIVQWMTDLYTSAGAGNFDYISLHYYGCGVPYNQVDTSTNGGPSLISRVNDIKQVSAQFGVPNKDIWLSEYNYLVPTASEPTGACHVADQATQALYMTQLLDYCRLNGISHCFWYDIESGTEDSSMSQQGSPTTYVQAYYTLQQYITSRPVFGLRQANNPLAENVLLQALVPILPAGTQLAAGSKSGTGTEQIFVEQKYLMSQGSFPAVLLSSGTQEYARNSTTTYEGKTFEVYVDYYNRWDTQQTTIDSIRAAILLELERMASNVQSYLVANEGIAVSGTVYPLSLVAQEISGYLKATDPAFPALILGMRRLSLTLMILPYSV